MTDVVVVGQTPPPFGGQAVMVEKMLRGDYGPVKLRHVRMAFSGEMDEIGKFAPRKLVELVRVIAAIVRARVRYRARILYYPPGGQNRLPILRDMAILIATRWMFRKTIFHFHASGLADYYSELSGPMRLFFRWAYFYPDAGIRLSDLAPEDAKKLRAKSEYIVPNGVEDNASKGPRDGPGPPGAGGSAEPEEVELLFVGVICESKGVEVLLAAARQLVERGLRFRLRIMGKFESDGYEEKIRRLVSEQGLSGVVEFLGVLAGEDKHRAFVSADIFAFPTFFESETFSVVLVEALSYGLPVVTTRWRAIPSIIEDQVSGFLVPVRHPQALSEKLETLIRDPDLRRRMGDAGRRRYADQFTLAIFHQRLRQVFVEMAA